MEDFFEVVNKAYSDKSKNHENILIHEMLEYINPFITNFLKMDQKEGNKQWLLFNIKKYSDCKKENELKYICESIVDCNGLNFEEIKETPNVESILNWLNTVPQPEQRTPEWYAYRHTVITASSLSKVLETKSTYQSILKEKVLPEKNFSFAKSKALNHGIRCEIIAQNIYESETNSKISEYGCIKHKHIDYIGASPDGIVTNTCDTYRLGRMLEIKCLYSRKLTGIPKYNYWIQMQIQLETCDLEYCDFFECKINEDIPENDFYNKIETHTIKSYYGIVIEYIENNSIKWIYSELNESIDKLKLWHENNIEIFAEENNNDNKWYSKTYYWELDKYSLITVKRNKEWFNLINPQLKLFWKDVENKRFEIENDASLISKYFPVKEVKRKISITKIEDSICVLDTDDES